MTTPAELSREMLADMLGHIPVASRYELELVANVCRRLRADGARIAELESERDALTCERNMYAAKVAWYERTPPRMFHLFGVGDERDRLRDERVGLLVRIAELNAALCNCQDDRDDTRTVKDARIAALESQLTANGKGEARGLVSVEYAGHSAVTRLPPEPAKQEVPPPRPVTPAEMAEATQEVRDMHDQWAREDGKVGGQCVAVDPAQDGKERRYGGSAQAFGGTGPRSLSQVIDESKRYGLELTCEVAQHLQMVLANVESVAREMDAMAKFCEGNGFLGPIAAKLREACK